MITTYVIEPARPGGHRKHFMVDDTPQGERFVAAVCKVFGAGRVHPLTEEPPREPRPFVVVVNETDHTGMAYTPKPAEPIAPLSPGEVQLWT